MIGTTHFVNLLYDMTEEELDLFLKVESQKIIDNARPEQQGRLRGLQWRLDRLRDKHKGNPTKTMIAIHDEMMESVFKLKDVCDSYTATKQ
jgi:hypothetical protein